MEIKSVLCEPYPTNATFTRRKKPKYGPSNYRIVDLSLWSPSANSLLDNVVPNNSSTQMDRAMATAIVRNKYTLEIGRVVFKFVQMLKGGGTGVGGSLNRGQGIIWTAKNFNNFYYRKLLLSYLTCAKFSKIFACDGLNSLFH